MNDGHLLETLIIISAINVSKFGMYWNEWRQMISVGISSEFSFLTVYGNYRFRFDKVLGHPPYIDFLLGEYIIHQERNELCETFLVEAEIYNR